MLEGKELEGKIGNVGAYSLDVDATGKVVIAADIKKDFGGAVVSNTLAVELSVFTILEAIVAKTSATWDNSLVATLEAALGIKKV